MPIPGGPFGTCDQNVPRALAERQGLRTWIQKAGAFLVDAVMPCTVALCIVPWGPARANSLLTHVNQVQTQLIGKDKFFGLAGAPNFDWPNPRGPLQPAITSRTHLQPVRLNLLGQDTFFSGPGCGPDYDWPNPRGPLPATSLKTHVSAVRLNLLGKDTFFGSPGCGPDYDWPNPSRGPQRSIDLLSWLQTTDLPLLGQDKFFGAAGQGPTFDWSLPRAASVAIDLKTSAAAGLALAAAPASRQIDWPVPRGPAPAADIKTIALSGLALTSVVQAPFGQGDWPNPRASSASIELRAWLAGTSLALKSRLPAIMPSVTTVWLVPWGPARHPQSHVNLANAITAQIAAPTSQLDWPVPRGPTTGSIELRTWINLSTALYNITYVFREPTAFRNWSTDARVAIGSQPPQNLSILSAPPPTPIPPAQRDWPNPRGPVGASDLRTWLQQFSIGLQATLPTFVPSTATAWFNPWATAPSLELRTWLQRAGLSLTAPAGAQAFAQRDWPNPRGPGRAVDLVTWLQASAAAVVLPNGAKPFGQSDWIIPRAAAATLELRTWAQATAPLITVTVAPFAKTDWPIPRTVAAASDLRTWLQSNLALSTFAVPFNREDWPNPRGLLPATSLRTHIDVVRLALRGQGKFFAAAGEAPVYDWPVPRGAVPATTLRTWSDSYTLALVGKDRFFGAAGQAPANLDWPNPRGPARLQGLSWTLGFTVELQGPPTAAPRTGLSVHGALGLAQLAAGTPAPSLPSIDPTVLPTPDGTRRLTVHGAEDDGDADGL